MITRTIIEIKKFKIYLKAEFDTGMTGGWGFDAPEEILFIGTYENNEQVQKIFNRIQQKQAIQNPFRTVAKKIFWEKI